MATVNVVEITDEVETTSIVVNRTSFGEKITVTTDAMLTHFDRERAAKAAAMKVAPKKRNKHHLATLAALRKLDEEKNSDGMNNLLMSTFLSGYKRLPPDQDLRDLALHMYPPRSMLQAQVCDFYPNHAVVHEVAVGDIEAQWQQKPEGVDVRWIHVPAGIGILHSPLINLMQSIEDLFRNAADNEPRPFTNAGRPGFPYVDFDALSFRHREEVEDLRDTYCLLSKLEHLDDILDAECHCGDRNPELRKDLEWRAQHLNVDLNFWELVASDMPWQIADGLPIRQNGPLGRIKPLMSSMDFRVLSSHPAFQDAQLVRNEFRFFHRSDGVLLTMSAAKGVNYLDARLQEYLQQSSNDILKNPNASTVGLVLNEFADTGTSTWEKPTAEWLLVYLATELGTCPHNDTLGHSSISMVEGYQDILRDLVRSCDIPPPVDSLMLTDYLQKLRTFEPWRRDETVRLTRTFLQCLEETKLFTKIMDSRLALFMAMKQDIRIQDEQDRSYDVPSNPNGISAMRRLGWATSKIQQLRNDSEAVSNELIKAMDNLLHLRTIEQNELTIVRDSQQRAIMLFTAVTVIFLPLSFCTSYFGMNVQGIAETTRTEKYFWYVCGTAGFLIVTILSVYAFWHPVKDHLMVLREQRKAARRIRLVRKTRLERRMRTDTV
ncbi:hypothetical protein FQN51_005023 [Onygenales sp. PD_10]|nr:hypothetical protein FQN51_005023 [Onygenales sp. PD_10]